MSNYTKLVNYIVKDSLPTGNPAKIIKGTELDNEFSAIASNMATKLDSSGGTLLNGSLSGTTTATGTLNVSGTTAFTGTTAFRNATNSFFNGAGTDAIFNIDGVNGKIYGSGVGTSGNQIELNRSSDANHPILAFTRTRGSLAAPTDNVAGDVLSSLDSYARIGGVSGRATYIRSEVSTLTDSTNMTFSVKNAGVETELLRLRGSQTDGNTAALVETTVGVRFNSSNPLSPFRITYTGTSQELFTINDPYARQFHFNTYYDGTDTKTARLFLSVTPSAIKAMAVGTNVFDSAFPVTPTSTGIGYDNIVTFSPSLLAGICYNSAPTLKSATFPNGSIRHYRAVQYGVEAGGTVSVPTQIGFDTTVGSSTTLGALTANIGYNSNAILSGAGAVTAYQLTNNVVTLTVNVATGQLPSVNEQVDVYVPDVTTTTGYIGGSRTVTAVDTVNSTFSFAFTGADIPLTSVLTANSGWSSFRNRFLSSQSGAPSLVNALVVEGSSLIRTPAFRVRNLGLGDSFVIEDQTSDNSAFGITGGGEVYHGARRLPITVRNDLHGTVTPRYFSAFGSASGNNQLWANYSATAGGVLFNFYKSRVNGTNSVFDGNVVVQGGDTIAALNFTADDGVTAGGVESARIQNRVCGLPSTGNVQSETIIYQRSGTGSSLIELTGYHPVASFSSDGLDVAANFGVKGNMITGGINLPAATIRATSALNFDSTPTSFVFNTDGTKLFVAGSNLDQVREYNLTTAWDSTTAVLVQSFSVAGFESSITGIAFNTTGTVLFVTGIVSDAVTPITLPTAFSLTGATIGTSVPFSTIFANTLGVLIPDNAQDIFFSADGLNLYILDSNRDRIYQAKLTVAFDLNTATFYGRNPFSLNVATLDGSATGIWISNDGTWGLFTGVNNDRVLQFVLSVPFDITTMHFIPGTLSVAAATPTPELNPSALFYRPELNRLYVMGTDTDDIIEYNVPRRTAVINHDTTFTNRVVLPRMTTVERDTLLNVVDGTVIYNTTTNEYNFRQAGAWVKPTMSAA